MSLVVTRGWVLWGSRPSRVRGVATFTSLPAGEQGFDQVTLTSSTYYLFQCP